MFNVVLVLCAVDLVISCNWKLIYPDTSCFIADSYGQRYTLSGCLARCEREGVKYCSFAVGVQYNELILGCGTDPDCCIGTDICAVTVGDINAQTYECIPTPFPTSVPTHPTNIPTSLPTNNPSQTPTKYPTNQPTFKPSDHPTISPTRHPSQQPSTKPTKSPSSQPTGLPTIDPSEDPSKAPSNDPTQSPTNNPSNNPTSNPSVSPSLDPTAYPSVHPTLVPTNNPSQTPTTNPSVSPSWDPTLDPTMNPTVDPTHNPSNNPTTNPSVSPTSNPTAGPTIEPTLDPTTVPTNNPSVIPTQNPTGSPTDQPSDSPSMEPTMNPTESPTLSPTRFPTLDLEIMYDSWINATFVLSNIFTKYINQFEDTPVQFSNEIKNVLETNYFKATSIEYRDFHVQIDRINEFYNITDTFYLKNNEPIFMYSRILSKGNIIGNLLKETRRTTFRDNVRHDLIRNVFYNNSNLLFNVTSVQLYQPTVPSVTNMPYLIFIFIGAGIIVLFLIIAFILWMNCKQNVREILVKKPMVVLVAIGNYHRDANNPDFNPNQHDLVNLPVNIDICNLCELFGVDNLNYAIFPVYRNNEDIKLDWTQQELVDFLKQRAIDLEQRIDEFDGLIVVISCHGRRDFICTSDYKLVEKVALHRLFSVLHPKVREIPRIFIYDCCEGNNAYGKGGITQIKYIHCENTKEIEMKPLKKMDFSQHEEVEENKTETLSEQEFSKCFTLKDVEEENEQKYWEKGTKNPDYMLVEINAANPGFESKMSDKRGSFLIYHFVQKMMKDLGNNKQRFMFKIFDEIETELQFKEQPKITYNNGTRYIKLLKNKN